jgi:hypothetical protein
MMMKRMLGVDLVAACAKGEFAMIPISPKSAASKGKQIRLSASVFLLIINMIYILSLMIW